MRFDNIMKNVGLTIIGLLLCLGIYAQGGVDSVDVEGLRTNLPIVRINTSNRINAQEKVMAHMGIICGKAGRNMVKDKANDYDGTVKIKYRGNSSLGFNQKKFTIETCTEAGKEHDASLLGMPAEHDWVLLAPYNDVSMMRDPLAFRMWEEMGHWAPRFRMVEMVLNGKYEGVYILTEKIKHDDNRVNIATLKEEDNSGRELTGGYLLRIDTYNGDDATFQSKVPGIGDGLFNKQIIWTCLYPKKKNLTDEQFSYIQSFIDSVELCIHSDSYTDKQWGYGRYLKVSSFVDYFIHTELSLNADAYKRSAYFYKTKQNEDGSGGQLYAGPVWDYNLAYGNCNFCGANDIYGWAYNGCSTNPTPEMWKRLIDDPSFRKKVEARYTELRKTILSDSHIDHFIDSIASLLADAQVRQYATYPELLGEGVGQDGMMAAGGAFPMMGGFPMPGMPDVPDSIGGMMPGFGDFPMPGMPNMPDSIGGMMPGFGGFPMMGMPNMPDFGNMQMPDFSNMPGMGMMPGFDPSQMPDFSNMQMPDFSNMPGMEGMGGMQVSWFSAYRVASYEEEIKMLKDWLHERLTVMDEAFLSK